MAREEDTMKFRLNLTKDEVEEMKKHLFLTDEELLLIQMIVEDRTNVYMGFKLHMTERNIIRKKKQLRDKIKSYLCL